MPIKKIVMAMDSLDPVLVTVVGAAFILALVLIFTIKVRQDADDVLPTFPSNFHDVNIEIEPCSGHGLIS